MDAAIEKIRSIYGLSRKIARGLGLHPASISQWEKVPLSRVPMVSKITGIPPHELRPDLPDFFPNPDHVSRETTKPKALK